MAVVIGIDAAWTAANASGVALVARSTRRWELLAVAGSYSEFYLQGGSTSLATELDVELLLASAQRLAGRPVDVVAADIPLAHSPIVARRISDNAVSRHYGAMHAGTHSPTALRPGALADRMRAEFLGAGYPLLTAGPARHGLIEVYPHPALIELASATRRLPYKAGKMAKYWPDLRPSARREKLLSIWQGIVEMLDAKILGVAKLLPLPDVDCTARELKSYEDALDSVVCAWVGTCAVDDAVVPFGDVESAIWVPSLRVI